MDLALVALAVALLGAAVLASKHTRPDVCRKAAVNEAARELCQSPWEL